MKHLKVTLRTVLATLLLLGAQLIQLASPMIPAASAATDLTTYPTPLPSGVVEKVQICHATDSNSNPYIVNEPSVSATDPTAGHSGHKGPVWSPSLPKHTQRGDIIPPFDYMYQGQIHSYAGMNWNEDSKLIWQYGCNPYNVPTSSQVDISTATCATGTDSVDTIVVKIVNTNDPFNETITYTATVKDSNGTTVATQSITLEDEWVGNVQGDPYAGTLTFSSLSAGAYTVTVKGNEKLPDNKHQTNVSQPVTLNQCHVLTNVVPVGPVLVDECGVANDTFTWTPITGVEYYYTDQSGEHTLSADTGTLVSPVHYTGGNNLVISARVTDSKLYVIADGATTSWTLHFTNKSCVEIIDVPQRPEVNDPCGKHNATWDMSKLEESTQYTWTLKENGHLIVTALGGYMFKVGHHLTRIYDFGVAKDSNKPCPVEPDVAVVQPTCDTNGTITLNVPKNLDRHAKYYYEVSVNGGMPEQYLISELPQVLTFAPSTKVSVKLVSEKMMFKKVLFEENYTMITPECELTPETPIVQPTCDPDSVVVPVDPTGKIQYSEPTYTGTGYVVVATTQGNYYFIDENGEHVQTLTLPVTLAEGLSCGSGSVTPEEPSTPATVTELPHTGSDGWSNLAIALVSAATVYGAVYFAQPRRS